MSEKGPKGPFFIEKQLEVLVKTRIWEETPKDKVSS